jgi:hypothetical protein
VALSREDRDALRRLVDEAQRRRVQPPDEPPRRLSGWARGQLRKQAEQAEQVEAETQEAEPVYAAEADKRMRAGKKVGDPSAPVREGYSVEDLAASEDIQVATMPGKAAP